MTINKILKDQQITLIRYAAETDPAELKRHERKLGMFERVLAASPYSHKTYYRKIEVETPSSARKVAKRVALSSWENEGGAR